MKLYRKTEKGKESKKRYNQKNIAKINKYKRERHNKNKDRFNAYRRQRHKEHPEIRHASNKVYRLKNPVKEQIRHRAQYVVFKDSAFRLVGKNKIECAQCHLSDIRVLDINHVNGGGRKEGLGGKHLYAAIYSGLRNIDGLNLLCKNCNWLHHIASRPSSPLSKERTQRKKEYWDLKNAAFTLVGRGKIECSECQNSSIRVLDINHVNGGGRKERMLLRGSDWLLAIVRGNRTIDDLNLLCKNCNMIHYLSSLRGLADDVPDCVD